MNPFERFLELRPQIMQDEGLMGKLRAYASGNPDTLQYTSPDFLGRGNNHTHFRIGRVGDLWLATREYTRVPAASAQRDMGEAYIDDAIRAHERGNAVPMVCDGVAYGYPTFRLRHFLLVEDLTRGGTADFTPARPGDEAGTRDGKPIYHDFEVPLGRFGDTKQYMIEAHMIPLNLEVKR